MRIVALLGPDGSGKTTTIDALTRAVGEQFMELHHFRANSRLRQTAPVVDPYGKWPHPTPLAAAKIVWWGLLHLTWGIRTMMNPFQAKPRLIVFDRFLYDIVADPLRYRVPRRLARLPIMSLTWPRPDLVVILLPSAEVIQSRKQEVAHGQTEDQILGYESLRLDDDKVLRISDVLEPDVVASLILDKLASIG